MSEIQKGSCHCGAVTFQVSVPHGLTDLRRCNCSLCRRKGAIMASVELHDLVVLSGQDQLTEYRWNTNTARHYFCRVCGIYTHHQRRSNPSQYGFNVACLEGVRPYDLGVIPIVDGASNSLVKS